MKPLRILQMSLLAIVAGLAFVYSCGGGGSEFTPSISYSGVETPAHITGENAVTLASEAYLGMEYIGLAGGTISLSADEDATTPAENALLNSQVLTRFREEAGITFLGNQGTVTASPLASMAGSIVGYCEGYAEVTGTVNERNGDFDLDVLFQNYSDDCAVYFNGYAHMNGGYPGDYIDHMTVFYDVLNLTGEDIDLTLSGKWTMDIRKWPFRETINIVTLDNLSGKTWWLKDYEILTNSHHEQEISGRFYDPDLGYVDLATEQPLKFESEDKYPFEGLLSLNGADDSVAWLEMISSAAHRTTCDEDGNGTTDFDSGIIHWPNENNLPIAVTGEDENVHVNSVVTLSADQSSDEDQDVLNYTWMFSSMPTGSQAVLNDPHSPAPEFIPDYHGEYTLDLIVSDGFGDSLPDQVNVTATLFDEGTVIFSLSSAPVVVAVDDVSGDSRKDIVMKSGWYFDEENDLKLFVFRQDGSGQLLPPVKYDTMQEHHLSEIASIDTGDLNSDGRMDVAVPVYNAVELFYQGSDGSLSGSNTLPCPFDGKLKIADIDGDSDHDLIVESSGDIMVFFQDDAGAFSSSTFFTSDQTGSMRHLADLNGDGLQDLFGKAVPPYDFAVLYQGTDNSFGDSIGFFSVEGVPGLITSMAAGDLNDDGLEDVLIAFIDLYGEEPGEERTFVMYFQDEEGDLYLGKVLLVPFTSIDQFTTMKLADLNHDGRKDIITNTPHGLDVFLQGPNSEFLFYHYGGSGNKWSEQGVAVGDVDGDGDEDIVSVYDTDIYGKVIVHYNYFY